MGIQKFILNIILSFFSLLLPFFPQKNNRVSFVSLTSKNLTGDMKQIVDKLSKEKEIEIKLVLFKYEHTLISSILYLFNCVYQLFIINTSKVVIINDNNYVISKYKKRNVKVIQIWHACGAVKKFGNEINRKYPIKNYDYVISSSDVWKEVYARSFNVETECVLPLGLPRTDTLLNSDYLKKLKENMYKKYPVLKNKYVILYAPTFRGNIIDGMYHLPIELDRVIEKLPIDMVIIYKLHPLLKDVDLGGNDRLLKMNAEDLYSLFSVSDCLISDYSSVLFDFSLLGKKEVYYIPDVEEYKQTIGLNINFDTFPGKICLDENSLIEILSDKKNNNEQEMNKFKNKYFKYQDGQASIRIVNFILQLIKSNY